MDRFWPISLIFTAALAVTVSPSAAQAEKRHRVPPDIEAQLRALSEKVEQLEKQLAAQAAHQQAQPQPQQIVAPLPTQPASALDLRLPSDAAPAPRLCTQHADDASPTTGSHCGTKPAVDSVAKARYFGLKSEDGNFAIRLGGLVQADGRYFNSGIKGQPPFLGNSPTQQQTADTATNEANSTFLMRRVRPMIMGTVYDQYNFGITADFGGGNTSNGRLLDAFIEDNIDPAFRPRIGKFSPPNGLENMQNHSSNNRFTETSFPTAFLPARDIGLLASGTVFSKTLDYSVGILNGGMDSANDASDNNNAKEPQVWLFAKPFINHKHALKGLGFGAFVSRTNTGGSSAYPTAASGQSAGSPELPTYNTIGQERFFSYRNDTNTNNTVFADGERTRLMPQLYYSLNNVGLMSEYMAETQALTRVNGTARNTGKLTHTAWHLTAAWAITGEAESMGNIEPRQNFDATQGGLGAWELVARVGGIDFDKDSFTVDGALNSPNSFAQATRSIRSGKNWGMGVNWYLNPTLRLTLDYDQTTFDWGGGGTESAPKNREAERLVSGRAQVFF